MFIYKVKNSCSIKPDLFNVLFFEDINENVRICNYMYFYVRWKQHIGFEKTEDRDIFRTDICYVISYFKIVKSSSEWSKWRWY